MQLLLDKGSDPAGKTGYGNTALKLAIRHGHQQVIELLQEATSRETVTDEERRNIWLAVSRYLDRR